MNPGTMAQNGFMQQANGFQNVQVAPSEVSMITQTSGDMQTQKLQISNENMTKMNHVDQVVTNEISTTAQVKKSSPPGFGQPTLKPQNTPESSPPAENTEVSKPQSNVTSYAKHENSYRRREYVPMVHSRNKRYGNRYHGEATKHGYRSKQNKIDCVFQRLQRRYGKLNI